MRDDAEAGGQSVRVSLEQLASLAAVDDPEVRVDGDAACQAL